MKNTTGFLLFTLLINVFSFGQAPGIQWQNTIGGGDLEFLSDIYSTNDGGYILGCASMSNISGDKTENSQGELDYWVIKIDSQGDILWQNTIGGSMSDELTSLQQTSDGGYILGGHSSSDISGDKTENSIGQNDYWILKLDEIGNIIWQNTIGGNDWEELYTVKETLDGGYILGGHSSSDISGDKTENSIGSRDYWIVKLDVNGNILWQNTIGGMDSDSFEYLVQTDDGGYIIGGSSNSGISGDKTEEAIGERDYWVLKLDSVGDIVWQNTIGGNGDEDLSYLGQVSDGGYIVGGVSWSDASGDKTEDSIGSDDYWIVKLNSNGDVEWDNTIGGFLADNLNSIKEVPEGGYIIAGASSSPIGGDKDENPVGGTDFWVVRLDTSGAILWQETIGGSGFDWLYASEQASDNGFVLAGSSDSGISGDKTEDTNGGRDVWVVKLEPEVLSIHDIDASFLEILPNPIQDNVLEISLQGVEVDRLEVFSITGKRMLIKNHITSKIDVSNLYSGVYIAKIFIGKSVTIKKFIVE